MMVKSSPMRSILRQNFEIASETFAQIALDNESVGFEWTKHQFGGCKGLLKKVLGQVAFLFGC
jgi:hypothetical protein